MQVRLQMMFSNQNIPVLVKVWHTWVTKKWKEKKNPILIPSSSLVGGIQAVNEELGIAAQEWTFLLSKTSTSVLHYSSYACSR